MMKRVVISKILKLDVDFFFFEELNVLFMKNRVGVVFLYLPKFYFFKNMTVKSSSIKFIFLSKFYFYSLCRSLFNLYRIFFKVFFFRLKLKGLGYRIKKINKQVFRFFLACNHYFYFFVPQNVFVWSKKRNFLVLSNDKTKLNDIFSQLILLKKMDFLEKTKSFIVPRKILYLKK